MIASVASVASVVLPSLFIGSGVFGTVVLGTMWRQHVGPSAA